MEREEPVAGSPGGFDGADTAVIADPAAQLASVAAERDSLAAAKAELEERLLRRQADFENFRKRVERDRADFLEFAAQETMRLLLPVLDDFERALQVECADKEYAKGTELIYTRLKDTLVKMGVEPIEALGKPFDPHVHHAIEMCPTADADDHTVLAELQKGYNFRGRLLRPSMVRVAVRPGNPPEEP